MVRKRLWNLQFGNKGVAFTLDAMAASIIVITILIVSYAYLYRTINDLPNLNILRTSDDIIAMIDYDGTLKTFDSNAIKNDINTMLPEKYDMFLVLNSTSQNLTIGNPPPNDRFVGSSKRFSVINNQNNTIYLTTRYWIWLK